MKENTKKNLINFISIVVIILLIIIFINFGIQKTKDFQEKRDEADVEEEEETIKETTESISDFESEIIDGNVYSVGVMKNQDIIIGNIGQNYIATRNPDGSYVLEEEFGLKNTYDIKVFDADNDGQEEVLIVNYDASILLYELNSGVYVGKKLENKAYGYEAAIADVDNDGDKDIIVARYNEPTTIYINENGDFKDKKEFGKIYGRSVKADDLDDDGDIDFVVGTVGQNIIYWNLGGLKFEEEKIGGKTAYTYTVEIIDYNYDGKKDLFFGNYDSENKLYMQNIEGFVLDESFERDYTETSLVIDYNDDGRLDIILGKYEEGVFALLNKESGWEEEQIYEKVTIHDLAHFNRKIILGNNFEPSVVIGY